MTAMADRWNQQPSSAGAALPEAKVSRDMRCTLCDGANTVDEGSLQPRSRRR
jgi:hypothetical protein